LNMDFISLPLGHYYGDDFITFHGRPCYWCEFCAPLVPIMK
jgi:hypothetical protein